MTMRALPAAQALEAHNVDVAVVHTPTIKPFDHEAIARAASGGRLVVTLENHTVVGGLADAVASSLVFGARPGASMPVVKRIGLPDEFLLRRCAAHPARPLRPVHRRHRGRRAEVDRLMMV